MSNWSRYLQYRDRFAALLDPDYYTIDWLDEQIRRDEFLVFTGSESAILTSIKVYPTGLKELHGQAAVGNLAEIIGSLIPTAEQFGRSIGCAVAVIESREGWGKVMKAHGYDLYQTSLRKVL